VNPSVNRIVNGPVDGFSQRYDTNGNIINASDGGIIFIDGVYHWYGLQLRPLPFAPKGEGGQVTDTGVAMYASRDLVNWEYEGIILECTKDENSLLRAPMRFERPKIIYNEKTKKYVLWCHFVGYPGDHGFGDTQAEAGVAVCDTVNGKYEFLGIRRPIDRKGYVRDASVYKDDDGQAYFIYDRHVTNEFVPVLQPFDRCLHIVKLNDDYTGFTDEWKRIDAADQREAPAIVKKDGWYYMITSGLTGWAYNPALYFRSRCLMHGWEKVGDPCVGDDEQTTFRTQSTFIFTTQAGEDILMCERHNTENFLHCSYIWFPIRYGNGNTLKIEYAEEFEIRA